MNKQQAIQNYIKETTGQTVSKKLLAFILNPQKLEGLNNAALKDIVVEYAPIFNKFRYTLDGSSEITSFNICLLCRITHKPELEAILGISE